MSGYGLMANSYKQLVEKGVISEEDAKTDIKIFEFLNDCSQDDIFTLFDSGAFNDIMKSYCKRALDLSGIDNDLKMTVMDFKIAG